MPLAAPLAGGVLSAEGAALVLAEWTDPGGRTRPTRYIAPLHVHHDDDEAWYVLEGTLRFRLGDEEVEAPAGAAVLAERGTPHTYWNPRPEPARYLLAMTPRIMALIDALHAPGGGDAAAIEAVFREHRSTYLGWLD
jgi:mannose-6-phosphate isomerase-like protein (cupin superfamily)